ncbi:MAG: BREX system P-loop protein BrxC [Acidobacteriota bacterium]
MKIENLFERDIHRPINGVVKADQLDESSIWQELDEFVVTKELDQHFRKFFSVYLDAIDHSNDADISGRIGIWVSGFFGSGKSHFIKVLSYLLQNHTHSHDGQSKAAVEFFESKVKDAMLFGDIKRAVASNTDVILFNIDSKADQQAGRDAILAVFLRVLNEMQNYSGDHPHIAHLERYLEGRGKLKLFNDAFRAATGSEWAEERDAYHFHRDEVVQALVETLGQSKESAEKWVDSAESSFALTVENFCKWVKAYLDSKGSDHRIIFLVDEVGQFIGTDSHLMLNLQTITEELGTICGGRAWIVVTSQEDIDAVLGEMKQPRANDFSKIQGRFRTRLSLSSANVDEVIQSRLLAKREEVKDELRELFNKKGDILKNQLTFINCGMTLKPYKDIEDFVRNYPFAPYQFQLVQKIFEMIRRAGATGLHLSRGERSILDAFQSAGKQVGLQEVGILVPLYRFYPSIESFLDTAVKKTIDQARDNASLEQPFDIYLLQVLFLIRYVEEVKGNVDNLVTLFLDEIDGDRIALRRKIEESLQRLEKETLISRSGDVYFFLTNEERDISREIKTVELGSGDESKLLGELIFSDVLKGQRKYTHPINRKVLEFNRKCDLYPVGNQMEGALLVSVITPLNDDYEMYDNAKCVLESGTEGGHIIIRLGNDETMGRELRTYLQTEKYIKHKNDGTLPESSKRILRNIAEDNQARRGRLVTLLSEMLIDSNYYGAGQPLTLNAGTPLVVLDKALEYLVQNTFTKMGYLKHLSQEPLKEVQAILRSNDIGQQSLAINMPEGNKEAIDDLRSYISLSTSASRQVVLHDLIEKRYSIRPYGWPDEEVLILIARLLILSEISLMMDGSLIPTNKVYEAIAAPAKRRKIIVIKRQTSDPKAVQNARGLGKELFHEMGPDGEDALFAFLQDRLKVWQLSLSRYKTLADTGDYPGKDEIDDGHLLIKKLLACDSSFKFIEQFNEQKNALLDFADQFHDLEHFYEYQKPTWENLRKSYEQFNLNQMELEQDAQAGPALRRMQEILSAPAPYSIIKEADELINRVSAVNNALITECRKQAIEIIDGYISAMTNDIEAAKGDDDLRASCLNPLKSLRARAETLNSIAHITQAQGEAEKKFNHEIHEILEKYQNQGQDTAATPVKKQRIVRPHELTQKTYLENQEDIQEFMDALRLALEEAIANNEYVLIR